MPSSAISTTRRSSWWETVTAEEVACAYFATLLSGIGARQPARLPAHPNATVGRAGDIDAVADLLHREEVRLVTLVGPGGVGKTRLAIEIARAIGERFPDGPGFVALVGTDEVEHVQAAVAGALGAQLEHGEPPAESLASFLGPRLALLVVDNLEHLVDAGPWLGEAITTCPGLHLIVTSREPLQIRAEYCYRVDPLPPASAASLLVDRARARDSRFEPETGTIADICAHLDGLPLAIELAAARLALLPAPISHGGWAAACTPLAPARATSRAASAR